MTTGSEEAYLNTKKAFGIEYIPKCQIFILPNNSKVATK